MRPDMERELRGPMMDVRGPPGPDIRGPPGSEMMDRREFRGPPMDRDEMRMREMRGPPPDGNCHVLTYTFLLIKICSFG